MRRIPITDGERIECGCTTGGLLPRQECVSQESSRACGCERCSGAMGGLLTRRERAAIGNRGTVSLWEQGGGGSDGTSWASGEMEMRQCIVEERRQCSVEERQRCRMDDILKEAAMRGCNENRI
ncbi:hypothetical protein S83_058248 [Arachis hypogaea]